MNFNPKKIGKQNKLYIELNENQITAYQNV